MATTTPREFEGEPTLTPEHVATITQWYHSALGDSDKAADGEDESYYSGLAEAFENVLILLHGMPLTGGFTPRTRTLHIGVDVEVLGAVLKASNPRYHWEIDGDGWECWGEAPATDVNDPSTLHLTLSTPVTDLQATVIVKELAQWLTLLRNQSNPIDNGTMATLTDTTDWAEDAALFKQHPTDDDQVVLTERKTLIAGRYELPPLA